MSSEIVTIASKADMAVDLGFTVIAKRRVAGSEGLTHNVDKAAFEAWCEAHAGMPVLKLWRVVANEEAGTIEDGHSFKMRGIPSPPKDVWHPLTER